MIRKVIILDFIVYPLTALILAAHAMPGLVDVGPALINMARAVGTYAIIIAIVAVASIMSSINDDDYWSKVIRIARKPIHRAGSMSAKMSFAVSALSCAAAGMWFWFVVWFIRFISDELMSGIIREKRKELGAKAKSTSEAEA